MKGIFGGNFDPIHTGHLILAMDAIRNTDIEKVIFVPAWISPFKKDEKITDYQHRYKMLELATEDNKYFTISDIEGRRKGVSYTYQTIKEIENKEENICLLIGKDQAADFKKWYKWKNILNEFEVYVFDRKGANPAEELLEDFISVDSRIIEISSTQVRRYLKNQLPVDYLIPEKVKKYIGKNKLY